MSHCSSAGSQLCQGVSDGFRRLTIGGSSSSSLAAYSNVSCISRCVFSTAAVGVDRSIRNLLNGYDGSRGNRRSRRGVSSETIVHGGSSFAAQNASIFGIPSLKRTGYRTIYQSARHFSSTETLIGGNLGTAGLAEGFNTADSAGGIASTVASDVALDPASDAKIEEFAASLQAALEQKESLTNWEVFCSYVHMPVDRVHDVLELMHHNIGFTWITIAICFPWVIKALIHLPTVLSTQLRLQRISPQLDEMMEKVAHLQKLFPHDSQRFQMEYAALQAKYGFNPIRVKMTPFFVMLMTAPIHASFFVAFREMKDRFPDSWCHEGMWWFRDLGAPDPFFALPVAVGALTYRHFSNSANSMESADMRMMMHTMGCAFGCMSVPIMHMLGAGFNLYCASNIVSSIVCFQLLREAKFRAIFGLKPMNANKSVQYDSEENPTRRAVSDTPSLNKVMMSSDVIADRSGSGRGESEMTKRYEDMTDEEKIRAHKRADELKNKIGQFGLVVQICAVLLIVLGLRDLSHDPDDDERVFGKKSKDQCANSSAVDYTSVVRSEEKLGFSELSYEEVRRLADRPVEIRLNDEDQ